jgi:hypothetical protein
MKYLSPLILVSLFTYSVGANAFDFVNLDEFPNWYQELIKQEKSVKKKSKLKIEQFNIDKKVKGKFKLMEESEGYWYYQVDIGTDVPVECHIFKEFDGPSNSLHLLIEHSLESSEAHYEKTITGQFNYALDVGLIGDTPYLLRETLYNLGDGEDRVSGILKGLVAQTNQSLQICLHNEVGYRQTFFSVFESFITAFTESEENTEFFEAIYKLSFDGIPVGYGREKYTTDNEGDVSLVNDTAFTVPVDANSMSRTDTLSISWSNPDGSLINAHEYSIDNSVLGSKFDIEVKDDVWHVGGELQGKAVNAVLEHGGWLASGFGSYVELANLMKSEEESTDFHMWISDADPTTVMDVTISKLVDNPEGNFKMKMGPIVMTYQGNENGVIERGYIEQAGSKMTLDLMYSKGEPKLP